MAFLIRRALLSDWAEVRDKVVAFNADYFEIPVDTEKLYTWFEQHLSIGVVFLSPNGLISGLFVEDPVRNWSVMAETAWYDTGRDGRRLLTRLVSHAADHSCDEVRMTTLATTPIGVVSLLERAGFTEIERSHRLLL